MRKGFESGNGFSEYTGSLSFAQVLKGLSRIVVDSLYNSTNRVPIESNDFLGSHGFKETFDYYFMS